MQSMRNYDLLYLELHVHVCTLYQLEYMSMLVLHCFYDPIVTNSISSFVNRLKIFPNGIHTSIIYRTSKLSKIVVELLHALTTYTCTCTITIMMGW